MITDNRGGGILRIPPQTVDKTLLVSTPKAFCLQSGTSFSSEWSLFT